MYSALDISGIKYYGYFLTKTFKTRLYETSTHLYDPSQAFIAHELHKLQHETHAKVQVLMDPRVTNALLGQLLKERRVLMQADRTQKDQFRIDALYRLMQVLKKPSEIYRTADHTGYSRLNIVYGVNGPEAEVCANGTCYVMTHSLFPTGRVPVSKIDLQCGCCTLRHPQGLYLSDEAPLNPEILACHKEVWRSLPPRTIDWVEGETAPPALSVSDYTSASVSDYTSASVNTSRIVVKPSPLSGLVKLPSTSSRTTAKLVLPTVKGGREAITSSQVLRHFEPQGTTVSKPETPQDLLIDVSVPTSSAPLIPTPFTSSSIPLMPTPFTSSSIPVPTPSIPFTSIPVPLVPTTTTTGRTFSTQAFKEFSPSTFVSSATAFGGTQVRRPPMTTLKLPPSTPLKLPPSTPLKLPPSTPLKLPPVILPPSSTPTSAPALVKPSDVSSHQNPSTHHKPSIPHIGTPIRARVTNVLPQDTPVRVAVIPRDQPIPNVDPGRSVVIYTQPSTGEFGLFVWDPTPFSGKLSDLVVSSGLATIQVYPCDNPRRCLQHIKVELEAQRVPLNINPATGTTTFHFTVLDTVKHYALLVTASQHGS